MSRKAGGCLVPEEEEADDEQDGGIVQRNRIGIIQEGNASSGLVAGLFSQFEQQESSHPDPRFH